MKIPKSPEEVEHFTSLFLETHGFPKCLGATDGTHNEVIEPRYHYPDYINRKGYTSINVQGAYDYKYCFVKWPGSVHDAGIFLNFSLNKILKDGSVVMCKTYCSKQSSSTCFFVMGRSNIPFSSVYDKRVFRGWEKR